MAPVMDDIVADFAAVCRPFEVAYKLANNIAVAAALSVTAAAGRNNKQRRKRRRRSRRQRRGRKQNNKQRNAAQRFNFIFYSKCERRRKTRIKNGI